MRKKVKYTYLSRLRLSVTIFWWWMCTSSVVDKFKTTSRYSKSCPGRNGWRYVWEMAAGWPNVLRPERAKWSIRRGLSKTWETDVIW